MHKKLSFDLRDGPICLRNSNCLLGVAHVVWHINEHSCMVRWYTNQKLKDSFEIDTIDLFLMTFKLKNLFHSYSTPCSLKINSWQGNRETTMCFGHYQFSIDFSLSQLFMAKKINDTKRKQKNPKTYQLSLLANL